MDGDADGDGGHCHAHLLYEGGCDDDGAGDDDAAADDDERFYVHPPLVTRLNAATTVTSQGPDAWYPYYCYDVVDFDAAAESARHLGSLSARTPPLSSPGTVPRGGHS